MHAIRLVWQRLFGIVGKEDIEAARERAIELYEKEAKANGEHDTVIEWAKIRKQVGSSCQRDEQKRGAGDKR